MAVDTDKGFVPRRGIMTPEMWQQIPKHYRHAVKKHPYFADVVARVVDNPLWKSYLEASHDQLKRHILAGCVDVEDVIRSEWAEIMEAYTRGDKAAAVEECYDAIAVLLRMVDVFEGRQPFGDVSKMETTGKEGARNDVGSPHIEAMPVLRRTRSASGTARQRNEALPPGPEGGALRRLPEMLRGVVRG